MRRYLITVVALFVAATAGADEKYIYTNHRLDYVKLESIPKKELQEKAPTHPATISAEKMRAMLASVQLNRKLLFGKEVKSQEVFNDRAVSFLAPKLVEAFQKASPNEQVAFSYLFKDPQLLIRNDLFTSAVAWVKGNEFHLKFLKLHAKLLGDIDKKGNFDKVVNRAKGLRVALETQPGQMLASSHADELLIDMSHAFATQPASVGGSTLSAGTGSGATLKSRLQELERLRKSGLINDQEYQAKRKELLNNI